MVFLLSFFLIFFASNAVAQPESKGLRVFSTDLRAGRLDPVTGKLRDVFPLAMPNTTACEWETGSGTRGQTSAIFYTNQTFFFLAREKCGVGRTFLFTVHGPYGTQARVYPLAILRTTGDLDALNVAWDHTCNLIVTYPDASNAGHMTVDQVSEYDGAQRIQPSYAITEGWKKVQGLGAVDFGNFRSQWPMGQELNCGQECLAYTLEEMIVAGSPVKPRAFIGRAFRQAKVMLNMTDSLQAQTLSWNPFAKIWSASKTRLNQFIGIGICCSESWCHKDCANYKDGNMVLFAFVPHLGFTILTDIGHVDKETIRLGVEFSPAPYSNQEKQAYVFYDNTILSYRLVLDEQNLVVKVDKVNQSPPLDPSFSLRFWANPVN